MSDQMSDTLWPVILAAIAFVGGHFVLSWGPVRGALVARLGRGPFLGVYSILVAIAFLWMNMAYIRAPVIEIWPHTMTAKAIAWFVMIFASVFLVCGAATANPTAVGGERITEPRGIFKVTRHPILWAVALWALAHMGTTGDVASQVFFGGLALLSLGGMAHIDAKKRAENPERFARLAAATSAIPFAALAAGRTRVTLAEIGWPRLLAGLALYLILLYGHEWAIGIVVAPRL
jgi:uncharacterized membrane protein